MHCMRTIKGVVISGKKKGKQSRTTKSGLVKIETFLQETQKGRIGGNTKRTC